MLLAGEAEPQRHMGHLRLAGLVFLLAGVFCFGAPLQFLARRSKWRLARALPVFFSRCLCRALRIRVHCTGSGLASSPRLIVANHVSWTDILVLGTLEPLCFLAKSEVAGWPVFGTLARLRNTVFVDRLRKRGIPLVNAQMAQRLHMGEPVVLFAEATTGDGTRVKRFHSSHFAAARDLMRMHGTCDCVVIQPVALAYVRRDGLPLGRAGRAGLAWYGDMALLPHLRTLLCGGPIDCEIIFTAPLMYQRGANRKHVALLSELAVRQANAAAIAATASGTRDHESSRRRRVSILLNAETA